MNIGRTFRQTLASLLRAPGYLLTVVAILGIGLGVAASGFTLLEHLLLRPLPAARLEGLVMVESASHQDGAQLAIGLCPPDALLYRSQCRSLTAAGLWLDSETAVLEQDGRTLEVPLQPASHDLLAVLGVTPSHGRGFRPEEDRVGAEPVALLGRSLWARAFASDPAILGRSVTLDGRPTRIVGILPSLRCSRFPDLDDGFMRPLALPDSVATQRAGGMVRFVGRLRTGVSAQAAQQELAILEDTLPVPPSWRKGLFYPRVGSFRDDLIREGRSTGLLLQVSTFLVLLIACANASNLMLGRGLRRSRELALRTALGAGPGTLAAGLFIEGLLLAGLGALVGLALQGLLLPFLTAMLPHLQALAGGIQPGWTTVAAMALLALLAALLAAAVPAWRLVRHTPLAELTGERSSPSPAQGRLAQIVVGVEVALATGLLFGSILAVRSLIAIQAAPPGFDPRGRFLVKLEQTRGGAPVAIAALLDPLRSLPGVRAAATASRTPMNLRSGVNGYEVPGPTGERIQGEATCAWVSADYFRTLGIPALQGRSLQAGDLNQAVVINETLARRHFPQGLAVGRRLACQGGPGMDHPLEIVGVVGAIHRPRPGDQPVPEIYFLKASQAQGSIRLFLWADGPGQALEARLRQVLPGLAPGWRIAECRTLDALLAEQTAPARASVLLLSGFSQVALLQAGFGLFSVLAFMTAARRREWAIRRSLGAGTASLVKAVLVHALPSVTAGFLAGLLLTLGFRRALEGLMPGLKPGDPLAFGLTLGFLALISALACLLPALRTLRVVPAEALRDA